MLYSLDCLDYLATIAKGSIDLVLTDPPYNIGFDGGKGWDSQWKTEEEYLSWCDQWTNECLRVLKPGRALVVFGTLKTDTFLRYKLSLSAKKDLVPQNEIIWSYNWGGRTKKNFARKHEYAWVYTKGPMEVFNADDVRVDRKVKTNLRTGKAFEKGTIPTCIWEFNNHTTSKEFCGWHPTTKNLRVVERIIKAYSNTGETVLDCFMGSGSTAVAAINTNRSWTGTELDPNYFKAAQDRINSIQPSLPLNQPSL